MGALEDEDPLAMIEVGAVPTVVTGVEARLINHCKMQVGKTCSALKCKTPALECHHRYQALPHPTHLHLYRSQSSPSVLLGFFLTDISRVFVLEI